MKIKTVILCAVFTLALGLGVATIAPATPNAKAVPAATAQPAAASPAAAAEPAPPHPEIRDALEALRRARKHIEEGAHDFGGHRADALRATDEAIHQLELCMKFE
jgi:hypothetical protein